jgi:hypothetical protein
MRLTMRHLRPGLALLPAAFLLSGQVLAYDLIGVGTWSCVAWQQAKTDQRSDVTEQWALGFLSGVAFASRNSTDPLRGLPPQALSDWLDRYCRSHPEDTIAHGTETFTFTFKQQPAR